VCACVCAVDRQTSKCRDWPYEYSLFARLALFFSMTGILQLKLEYQ
jgi:hypothetical protein